MELAGFSEIIMPDNYIVMNRGAHTEEENNQIILHAENQVMDIIDCLKSDRPFPKFLTMGGLVGQVISGPVNPLFYKVFIDPNGFTASSACTGCRKCAKACPLKNIEMEAEKPHWGKTCTHCMSCAGNLSCSGV